MHLVGTGWVSRRTRARHEMETQITVDPSSTFFFLLLLYHLRRNQVSCISFYSSSIFFSFSFLFYSSLLLLSPTFFRSRRFLICPLKLLVIFISNRRIHLNIIPKSFECFFVIRVYTWYTNEYCVFKEMHLYYTSSSWSYNSVQLIVEINKFYRKFDERKGKIRVGQEFAKKMIIENINECWNKLMNEW